MISLLQTIDHSRYDVDLLLFKAEGMFLTNVPKKVNILDPPVYFDLFDMSFRQALASSLKKGRLDIAINRMRAGLVFRTEKNRAKCEQRVWKYISKSIPKLPLKYDVAIGYLEKNPIYYCVEKVKADIKIGFIHNDYVKLGMDPDIDMPYLEKLDQIVTVSEHCVRVLQEQFLLLAEKVKLMHNIVSAQMIRKLSMDEIEINVYNEETIILSIGRLNVQKGFDLALEACRQLKKNNFKIKWYVIGEGEERANLERLIQQYRLQDTFILLGLKENPYPYLRLADIYVQPSRFEGKSIAIDEAKITHKPIVVTNFSTVTDQINHGKSGLIVEMNVESLVCGIVKLMEDEKLRKQMIRNLVMEELDNNGSGINTFYDMIS